MKEKEIEIPTREEIIDKYYDWLYKEKYSVAKGAELIGVSRQTLNHFVQGYRKPSDNIILKIINFAQEIKK